MRAFLCLLSLFSAATAVRAAVQVHVHFSPVANLIYQLDCISGELAHCSRSAYRDLWEKNFLKGEADEARVKAWGELMNRYRPGLEFDDAKQLISGRFEGVTLATKIRIASFQAAGLGDYFTRLDLLVTPRDRPKFESVVRHFYPVFEKWWKATALPKGKGFARETESLLRSRRIAGQIGQYGHFYEAELPAGYIIHFNLFYRPAFKESTSGQQIENYSVAEFLPSEKPVDRIDVVIHELCHFFYESGADENFAKLRKAFADSASPSARGAYNLLNEALATVLGNGLVNKLTMTEKHWGEYSAKELSFYNNYHIDGAARALLPWMENWLAQGKTVYDAAFVPEYVALLEKKFGRELSAPRLVLNELVLVADSGYGGKFRDAVRKAVRASSMYTSEGAWSDERTLQSYRENAGLSALLIVHPSNLRGLKNVLPTADFDAINAQLKKSGRVLFSYRRTAALPGYVIVAPDYEQALALVEKIGLLKEGFDGPYLGP